MKGGKSLCYQLPALVGGNINVEERAENSSVTIVVCPLIALMTDQVNNLHNKGIRSAACWSSSHNAKAKEEILNRLQTEKKKTRSDVKLSPIQLLYCVSYSLLPLPPKTLIYRFTFSPPDS